MGLLTPVASAHAPVPLRYDAPGEPVLYESYSPWQMYWLTPHGDTLGRPVTTFAVERWDWSRRADGLLVTIAELSLDTRRTVSVDTFDVEHTGRVTAIDSNTDAPRGRWDLLPYLPDGITASVGVTWTDAIDVTGDLGPLGQRYTARRVYRIARIFDSVGVKLAEIASRGEVRFRDSHWVDSSAGLVRWLDVRGPINERALLRLADGVLDLREWEMDLRGVGGDPQIPGDSVRAGLHSAHTLRRVSPDRYALLARPLDGTDTTYSVVGQELAVLHVASATPHRVVSGVGRADGWVGTATSTFSDGAPRSHEALWSSHHERATAVAVHALDDTLRITGERERGYAIPEHAWAVADHGMTEHLVPALLRLERTWTFRDFSVFRPLLGVWDAGTARVLELDEGLLAEIVFDDGASALFVIFSENGELLYTEGGHHQTSFRVPRPGSEERDRLDRVLQQLQQRNLDADDARVATAGPKS